jgi:hypothetical protein
MSSCTTGFHHWCDGCTCTCHPAPFDWSGTGQFDDLLNEVDAQEHAPNPEIPAIRRVALAANPDNDEKFWDEFFGLS